MKCCRVFRDGFPRQSTIYRGFPLHSVFHDEKHAIPRWGLKKTRPRYVVENHGKCKKTRCALCKTKDRVTRTSQLTICISWCDIRYLSQMAGIWLTMTWGITVTCFIGIMSLLRHSILRQSLLRHLLLRQSLLRLLILRQWPIVFAIQALLAVQIQLRERPFNSKKKYSDSQCCWTKYSDFGGGKKIIWFRVFVI
jgi:hypothetical protein